jgi:hypothetical protein
VPVHDERIRETECDLGPGRRRKLNDALDDRVRLGEVEEVSVEVDELGGTDGRFVDRRRVELTGDSSRTERIPFSSRSAAYRSPRSSSATAPTKTGWPPSAATPAAVLATVPPDAIFPSPTASRTRRAVAPSMSVIAPGSMPKDVTRSKSAVER